jgi:PAS domain S-box-containing protein
MQGKPKSSGELRQLAEARLKGRPSRVASPQTEADARRLLHELQVHQVEMEMQNTELQEARERIEIQLQTYTDLYDFAPVGYYSVDEDYVIMEANLTGATLLGIERARLIHRRFLNFVPVKSRATFQSFFQTIFADSKKQICVVSLVNEKGDPFWAHIQATPAGSARDAKKWCRMAVSNLTTLKQAEEVLGRMESLATTNRELKREIIFRQKAEVALKKSETEALHMQEQLRHLSRQLLLTQEEERKRISRELHDEIVQTLVGINVHLASLTVNDRVDIKSLRQKLLQTRRLVENSVNIVHRFARELRPTVLDDLGLVPALQSFIKYFTKRTNIRIHFTSFAAVGQLSGTQRTVLYRVAQSALSNVEKHAQASSARVTIRKLRGVIRLEIHDNGKSFALERVLLAKRHKRLGLLGSRERMEMIGGTFEVKSAPGRGTTIRAEIPIAREASTVGAKSSRKSGHLK